MGHGFGWALFGLVGGAHEARGTMNRRGWLRTLGGLGKRDRGGGPKGIGGLGIKTGESGGCTCKGTAGWFAAEPVLTTTARDILGPAGSTGAAPLGHMMTAGPSLIMCRQQLRQQPESEMVEGWSGANGAACRPTPTPYLCREVFQVEHFQLVAGLDAPSRKVDLDT
jgi:hypothetical protein